MRILIVDDEPINASKLKLVLSKYGNCDIASTLRQAVEVFRQAHTANLPYGFVTLEMDKQEQKGMEVAAIIRKWENENQKEPSKILLSISESDLQPLTTLLQQHTVEHIIKPFNRKKLDAALAALGLEKSTAKPQPIQTTPAAPTTAAPQKPLAGPTPTPPPKDDKEVALVLKKLTHLVSNEEQMQGGEPRPLIEDLVKRGGKQAELLLGQLFLSHKIPLPCRLELVRCAGYIKSPHFLFPLNKILDTEDNIRLVEGALIAIAKYSNQRALNILNVSLKKLKHPMLINTIRREIAKIKQDNPVLSILPRFLQSYKNHKNFRVTVDILKKILTPKDTHLFINYLKSGNDIIEDATFEILCFSGDPTVKTQLFNFFEDRIQKVACIAEKQCDELFQLMSQVQAYFMKNPAFIDEQFQELKELYPGIADIQVKEIIVSILCKSQATNTLTYIKSIYDQEENLQECIIDNLSGNQEAVDFLFEKYHAGNELKDKVVTSLLKSKQGVEYFLKHFFTFEIDKQEVIVRNLPYSNEPHILEFMRAIFKSERYSLKNYLMSVLRDNYLFSFKDVLYDPDNQREFAFMGKEYLDTITRLFPITTIETLYKKIADDDISTTKMKKYLDRISAIAVYEPVIRIGNIGFENNIFEKIYKAGNIELNTKFFNSLENIKALGLKTYKFLSDETNTFTQARGAQINEGEKGAITKLKQRFRDQFPDIRALANFEKELLAIFATEPISPESLVAFLKANSMSVAINIEKVISLLAIKLKNAVVISTEDRDLLFVQFPMIAQFVEYAWSLNTKIEEDLENIPPHGNMLKEFAKNYRLVLSFKKKGLTAFFKDQLEEINPFFPIVVDAETLEETDMLVSDTAFFKEYINRDALKTKRTFLYLENRMDYGPFRELNPKGFMKPISGYRLSKMILQELFFPR